MSRKLDAALAAICAHESGWGASRLARERNNLAGLGAYRPGLGMTFESRGACIDYLARLLAGRPGTLTEVGAWYAEDPAWAQKVAGCMRVIVEEGWRHENKTASPGLQRVQRARTAM